MTVLGNRGLSLRKLIITQLLSICRLVTSSFKRQKQTLLILFTLGCNFRVWSTILKQVKNPQPPSRNHNKNSWSLQGVQNAPFSHSWLFFGGGGKGSKSSIMIATRVKNRMKQPPPPPPPPHLPENKDKTRESQNMAFIWGGGGS